MKERERAATASHCRAAIEAAVEDAGAAALPFSTLPFILLSPVLRRLVPPTELLSATSSSAEAVYGSATALSHCCSAVLSVLPAVSATSSPFFRVLTN
ncbi:hypothetical protein AHAS_Ahas02G0056400 [Arachis hypogaea]